MGWLEAVPGCPGEIDVDVSLQHSVDLYREVKRFYNLPNALHTAIRKVAMARASPSSQQRYPLVDFAWSCLVDHPRSLISSLQHFRWLRICIQTLPVHPTQPDSKHLLKRWARWWTWHTTDERLLYGTAEHNKCLQWVYRHFYFHWWLYAISEVGLKGEHEREADLTFKRSCCYDINYCSRKVMVQSGY